MRSSPGRPPIGQQDPGSLRPHSKGSQAAVSYTLTRKRRTKLAEPAMVELVLRSSRDELRQQLQSIIGNLDATATFKDGLTALSAYMMFALITWRII